MIIIKANQELFNLWNRVGYKVLDLKSIMQNDMELNTDDILEFIQHYRMTETQLKVVFNNTMKHILQQNPGLQMELFEVERKQLEKTLNELE